MNGRDVLKRGTLYSALLTPGIAHLYNEGDLHSPSRKDSTKLIRIEGINMEKVRRFKFEAV